MLLSLRKNYFDQPVKNNSTTYNIHKTIVGQKWEKWWNKNRKRWKKVIKSFQKILILFKTGQGGD